MCALRLPPIAQGSGVEAEGRASRRLELGLVPPIRVQESVIADLQARRKELRARLVAAGQEARGDAKVRVALAEHLRQRRILEAEAASLGASLRALCRFSHAMRTSVANASPATMHINDQVTISATSKKIRTLENRLELAQVRCNTSLQECAVSRDKILEALNDMSVFNKQYFRLAASVSEVQQLLEQLLCMASRSLENTVEYRSSLREMERRMELMAPPFHYRMMELLRMADDGLLHFLSRRNKPRPADTTLARVSQAKLARHKAWSHAIAVYLPFLSRAHDMSPEQIDSMRRDFEEEQQYSFLENIRVRNLRDNIEVLLKEVLRYMEQHKPKPVDEELEAKKLREIEAEAKAKAMSEVVEVTLKSLTRMFRLLDCDDTQLRREGGLTLANLDPQLAAAEQRVRDLHEQSRPPPSLEHLSPPSSREVLDAAEEGKDEEELEEDAPMMVMASCMERAERRRVIAVQPQLIDRHTAKTLLLTCHIVKSDVMACRHASVPP